MIILASKSPRRIELMNSLGFEFKIEISEIDEASFHFDNPFNLNQTLALEKAKAIAKKHSNDIVIGSDTIVTLNNEVLGKPKDKKDAMIMLEKLSGKTHEVVTSIAIIKNKKIIQDTSISKVTFYEISKKEIEDYLKTNEAYDKAGGYAIQGNFGKKFIKNIEGDYYAIMGLPIAKVYHHLKRLL